MKYSENKTFSQPFAEISDNTLRAIEYSSFSYLIDRYHVGKSAINKALALGLTIGLYEYGLENYYYPKATEVKGTTKMEDRNWSANKNSKKY